MLLILMGIDYSFASAFNSFVKFNDPMPLTCQAVLLLVTLFCHNVQLYMHFPCIF
jgi:hypothetical protein